MTGVIQRYKLVFIVLGLIAIIAILGFVFLKEDANKIPSRGIFVCKQVPVFYTDI